MRLTRRARDGIWLLSYTDPSGARRRRSTGTRDKAEAERAAHHLLADGPALSPTGSTLGHALDRLWELRWAQQKSAQQNWYVVEQVRRELGSIECRDITYALLERAAERWRDAGRAASTVNARLSTISVALDYAAKHGWTSGTPPMPRQSVRNGRLRWLTDAEERALLRAVPTALPPCSAAIMSPLLVVLADTGARLSEITRAGRADMPQRQELRLTDTKNGSSRTVPLTSRASEGLLQLWDLPLWDEVTRGARDSKARQVAAKNWLGSRFTQVRDAAGLPDVSLHTLRHTCASRLVQAGVELYRVKAWLGHASVTQTERYAHLAPSSLQDAAARLERAVAS